MHPGFQWIGKSADGKTVTLRKFEGQFKTADYYNADWAKLNHDKIRIGVALDVETTGLNKKTDTIIEIGLRQFKFNRATGDFLEAGQSYSGLQDPGKPLSDEIIRLTGLTDEMLRGKAIDWNAVSKLLSEANLVLAHNAGFDRPFVERMTNASTETVWGCSFKHIDWNAKGFASSKLEILSIYHGFFTDAHRALADVDALLNLLSMTDWTTHKTYLNELLTNARRPMAKVVAANSPFESKDILKERGYSWDNTGRAWHRTLYKDELQAEIAWLQAAVYKGDFKGTSQEFALSDNFKS